LGTSGDKDKNVMIKRGLGRAYIRVWKRKGIYNWSLRKYLGNYRKMALKNSEPPLFYV
jgi:hypothetical protein